MVKKVLVENDNGAGQTANSVWSKLRQELVPYLETKYKMDIGAGHLGNGITVWNRNGEEHGDYAKVFHIGEQGRISIYNKRLKSDPKVKQIIDGL